MKKLILLFSYLCISVYTIYIIHKPIYKIEEDIKVSGTILEISEDIEYNTLIVQAKNEKYLVYTSDKQHYKLGEMIYIEGKKKTPEKNRNFYLFNYQRYLKSKKINYIISAKKIEKINNEISIIFKVKNKFLTYVSQFQNKEYFLLFLYGKNELNDEIYENYKEIGIVHLFALSGMHIHFFIAILNKIFKKNKSIIIIFLISYLFFVTPSPSIFRASLSEIIYRITNKKFTKKQILIFLFFLFLLYNPYLIYHIGFQLSFLISITLLIFKEQNNKYIPNLFRTSLKSFLASMPILINQTFSLNFLTPIWNLFFIPFVTYLFFPSILLCFIIPKLEFLLNYEVILIENISNILSQIDFLIFSFPYLNIYQFLIFYFLIYLTLYRKRYIILLTLFLSIHYFSHVFLTYSKITFIDIDQGDSILLEKKGSMGATLIDTGGKINKEMTHNILIPILKSRGIHKLDFLILTHGDYDHMGEAINLVNHFKVENVILNNDSFNELEQELIKVLDKKNINYYKNVKELNISNNKLYFLNHKLYDNENDNSNVIYTELSNHKFLLMGDAGVDVEDNLIEKYNLQDIDVLKVGHHGSKTSSSKEFINATNPKYSIISVGKNNRYGHPNKEVLSTLINSKIYRTDQDGSIMFKIKNNKLQIETCSP